MNRQSIQIMTRTGLLLAATLILQGLRLLIPIPPQVSMFLIGSLVNACLTLAALNVGCRAGILVAVVTPVFAWMEGMLPFFPFIFPVACGNSAFILAAYAGKKRGLMGLYGAALLKACVVYGAFYLLFGCLAFPDTVRHVILTMMSWPQAATGIIGATLGYGIARRIPA